jgi:hypothetical protein
MSGPYPYPYTYQVKFSSFVNRINGVKCYDGYLVLVVYRGYDILLDVKLHIDGVSEDDKQLNYMRESAGKIAVDSIESAVKLMIDRFSHIPFDIMDIDTSNWILACPIIEKFIIKRCSIKQMRPRLEGEYLEVIAPAISANKNIRELTITAVFTGKHFSCAILSGDFSHIETLTLQSKFLNGNDICDTSKCTGQCSDNELNSVELSRSFPNLKSLHLYFFHHEDGDADLARFILSEAMKMPRLKEFCLSIYTGEVLNVLTHVVNSMISTTFWNGRSFTLESHPHVKPYDYSIMEILRPLFTQVNFRDLNITIAYQDQEVKAIQAYPNALTSPTRSLKLNLQSATMKMKRFPIPPGLISKLRCRHALFPNCTYERGTSDTDFSQLELVDNPFLISLSAVLKQSHGHMWTFSLKGRGLQYNACITAIGLFLAIRKYRHSILDTLPKDIISLMTSNIMFESYADSEWLAVEPSDYDTILQTPEKQSTCIVCEDPAYSSLK